MVVHLFIGMIDFFQNGGSFLAFVRRKERVYSLTISSLLIIMLSAIGRFWLVVMSGSVIWLGRAQGSLTLIWIFIKYIVIGTYDISSSCWMVCDSLDNFVLGLYGHIISFLVWIDNKQVYFIVWCPSKYYHDLIRVWCHMILSSRLIWALYGPRL